MGLNMSFEKLTNRNAFFKEMEREVLKLINPATGEPFDGIVEKVDCPSCGFDDRSYFLKKWGFTYNKCIKCKLIYVSPRLTEKATIDLYKKGSKANEMYSNNVTTSDYEKKTNEIFFKEQLDVLKGYKIRGRLLDVGCRCGQFLLCAQKAGYVVEGLEIHESSVRIALSKGLKIRKLLLTEEEINRGRFDIITMFGVLEHLLKPSRDVEIIHSMLNENGIFMAITPNAQSLVGMLLHDQSRFYTPRNHPVIFTFDSIRNLFERKGFEVLHIDTVLTGYDSIANYVQNSEPFGDLSFNFLPPKFKRLLENKERFEELILHWDLGLRLRIIAKKTY